MTPIHVRVFLSSPGDVHDERSLARKVIESLPKQPFIRNRATLEVVSWDDPDAPVPVYANLTPQEALRRHMKMPSQCDIVVAVLWGRLGTPLPENDDFYRKPDGGRYLSGTEWEFADAIRAGKDVLLYRRSEKPVVEIDDPERDAKAEQYSLVTQFFQRFTSADRSLNGLWRPYKGPSEFERLLDNDVRAVLERLLASRLADAESGAASPIAGESELPPYPGLRRLTEHDAAVFFGRGGEVDALVKLITDGRRFVSVIGASGSGKSSLVRAGLLPRLRGNAVSGSKDWKFVTFAPADLGDNPYLALAAALVPLLASGPAPIQLADDLATNAGAAARLCDAALSDSPGWARLAIVIDQLEELFTIAAPARRDGFVRTIDALAAHPRVVMISTLRTDFFADATNWGRLADLLREGNYLLMPPGLRALSDIIALPAARAGIEVEPALLERIIEDAGLQPGTLPLLAYTLEQLYNAGRRVRALTRSDYESLGGIRGAISKRADESLRLLDAATVAQLPRMFRQLLTINSAGIVTRRRARQRDVITNPETATLVRTLVEARLLIADSRDGENTIEVAHEALFEGWNQMRSWIANNREYLLWRNRLRVRLEDWLVGGRDESSALRGGLLQEALKWLELYSEDLTDEERIFIRWPLSDEFQIRGVIASARAILESAPERVSRERQRGWLTALILAGQDKEIDSLTSTQPLLADVLTEARINAATLLALAGELDAAKGIAIGMTGIARSEAASRVAEIAASSGKSDAAAGAALLIADEQLTKRALARALACSARGPNCQFTIESLLHMPSLAALAPSIEGHVQLDTNWPVTIAGAMAIASPVLRAGVLTTAVSALEESGQHEVVQSALRDLETSLASLEERYWLGLIAVRVSDVLGAAGAFTEAEQLATRIASGGHRAHARAILARHRVSRGYHDESVALCSQALDDVSKSGSVEPGFEHVIVVAGLLGRAGRTEEGRRIALDSLETATLVTAGAPSANVLVRVGQALALCNAVDESASALGRISVVAGRAEAFRSVARALAQYGYVDRVMTLAQKITSPLERAELLACAAGAWSAEATASQVDAADAILACLAEGKDRRRLYSQCVIGSATMLIKCHKVPELLNALRAVEGKHERVEAWIAVMERLGSAGRSTEAQELADESLALIDALDDHDQRARAFAHLAGVIARCGRLEDAHRTARRCHLVDEQLSALTEILRSWIARDRYRELTNLFWVRQARDDGHSMTARLVDLS